jgi:hypothetical protein
LSCLVLCPTRGRPDNARAAYKSFLDTKRLVDTTIAFIVDDDDPERAGYEAAFDEQYLPTIIYPSALGAGMANALNYHAMKRATNYDVIGFIGDDHRFRTPAWDKHIVQTLNQEGGGIAYANDLFQSERLPTQVFISSNVLVALGWFCLPGAKHLYLDDAWKTVGEAADCLFYFPQVVIEHMHPAAGKAEWDPNYERVNDQTMYSHDAEVFARWKEDGLERDVARIRGVFERLGGDGGLE